MTTSPIRKKEDILAMKRFFLSAQEYRNYTLFVLGINTALRISDLLTLTWKDVYEFEKNCFKEHIYMIEKKTEKQNCIILNDSSIESLDLLKSIMMPVAKHEFIFFSRNNRNCHIGRNRAYHIIKNAAMSIGIEGNISCHSLRKTFGYHAWRNGTPPALIMDIYNHSSIEITKQYLSITQDDQDEVFLKLNL